jgi:dipeptidyl aminopeptidase/acylaminoacyl peptidase
VADPEVVIRQARARQRRRRRRAAAAVALALVAGAGAWLAIGRPGAAKPARTRPAGPVPTVNAAAFAGHGELAFISRGTLWVLDGATGALRRVATPGMTPSGPVFSADGRWLAFTGTPASPAAQAGTVWLAAGDGSGAHQVAASGGLIGWSPAAGLLAVTSGNTVRLIRPPGPARTLVRAARIQSAAWSPGGSALAVATGSASASTLASYPVAGGRPTTWLRLPGRSGLTPSIGLAGWWRRGIGYWALGDCSSCNADGDVLFVIRSARAHPRPLGATLTGSGLDQVAAAPNGSLAIVAENQGQAWAG